MPYYISLQLKNKRFDKFDVIIMGSALHTLSNNSIREAARKLSKMKWESMAMKSYKMELEFLVKVKNHHCNQIL